MSDRATPNLPSRDFAATAAFYGRLGFAPIHRDDRWMILRRGDIVLEFFPHPELRPEESWFSCCLRLDDLAAFYRTTLAAGLPEGTTAIPRLHAPAMKDGLHIGALIDPDGTLLRLIRNEPADNQQPD